MFGKDAIRKLGALGLVTTLVGAGAASLHAQTAPRPSLTEFPDAQRALNGASIDDRAALNSILTTLESGDVSFYFGTQQLKANEDARVALVRTLGPMLSRIVASEMFRNMYSAAREERARSTAGTPPVDPAITRADQISEVQLAIADMQARLGTPGLSRRDRSQIESAMSDARERVAAAQRQAQDPATRAADAQQYQAAQAAYETQRQEALAGLEADLPSDVRVLARRRLEAFVAGCRDVNFRARTTTAGGVTRFENPADEARPRIWKLCFRAGQRTVTEARRIATRWIGSLPRPPRAARH